LGRYLDQGERYQQLRDKHPEALMAFEAELSWRERRRSYDGRP
jgi:hypothetical protein